MEINTKLIEESTKEEVIRGYSEDNKGFKCLLCGEYFTKGEIYDFNGRLYEAHKMVQLHIEESHESVLSSLLKLSSNDVGISDLQLGLLSLFAGGLSDKQISEHLGVASSTIRNHRYKLREKERQAKVFLVIMELLEQKQGRLGKNTKSKTVKTEHTPSNSHARLNNNSNIAHQEVAATVSNIDVNSKIEDASIVRPSIVTSSQTNDSSMKCDNKIDNTNIKINDKNTTSIKEYDIQKDNNNTIENTYNKTEGNNSLESNYLYVENMDVAVPEEDKKTVLAMHLTEYGRLKSYPTTLQAQKIVLEYVIESFIKGKKYVDSEVDIILMSIYVDYKVLKRELIEQGFLSRSDKGGIYWVKGA